MTYSQTFMGVKTADRVGKFCIGLYVSVQHMLQPFNVKKVGTKAVFSSRLAGIWGCWPTVGFWVKSTKVEGA